MSMFSLRMTLSDVSYCRAVNQLMITTYVGGIIQLGYALWGVGNCMSQYNGADYRYGVANCRPQDVAGIKNGSNQGNWDLGISKTCSLADVHTQLIYCCDLIKP